MNKASEVQVAGSHYKEMPIQPAEFCQRNRLNWCEANVVKYVCRHANKKGAEDIDKAIHYLQLLKEWEYGEAGDAPMIPDGVTDVGAVQQGTGEGAATCPHFDGTICLAYPGAGANFDCYRCGDYSAAEVTTAPGRGTDLLPIFTLITKEHARSLGEHEPWEEAVHSPDTMLAVIKAELAEVELALTMGDHAETVKELVHTANTIVKAIAELTRRGHL